MPKCRHCKAPYTRTHNGIETWCSVECGYQLARKKQSQAYKAETRVMRKAANEKSVKWLAAKAKTVCHLFIRTRDAGKGCRSCGTKTAKQYHAGHFISSHRGAALRYDERNIFLQCAACNDGNKLSGNLLMYRAALARDYGEDYVQELERIGHEKKTWKIPDLQEVIEYYKAKLKAYAQSTI